MKHRKSILIIGLILGLTLAGCRGWLPDQEASRQTAQQESPSDQAECACPESQSDSSSPSPAFRLGNTPEEQIIDLYESASPSVVNITSVAYVHNRMLGELPSDEGVGSGFVYDEAGHIVTNYHVIQGADELLVTLASGEEYKGEVVGADPVNDIAVISIDAGEDLPDPLPLADSDQVRVGEVVLAIGNPYGLDRTLTTGVVSALGRVIDSTVDGQFIPEAIQTDAAINPGNSGGPLLDLNGDVIGVNSQIVSNSGSSAGLGFAISSNMVSVIVPELIQSGEYLHPWLGAKTIELTPYTVALLKEAGMKVKVDSGLLVIDIEKGSPAASAGLKPGDDLVRFGFYILRVGGDIITAIDDQPVSSLQDLMIYLETQTQIGDTVQLTVIRDGKTIQVPVKLDAQRINS